MKGDLNNRAKSKALVITQLMRIASNEGVSINAQALLATIIAESWPVGSNWQAKLGYPVLEERLGIKRNTIRRAIQELELARLIRFAPGHGHRISVFRLAKVSGAEEANLTPEQRGHQRTRGRGRPLRGATHDPSPVHPRPREGSPMTPQRVHP